MICQRCLLRAAHRSVSTANTARQLSRSTRKYAQAVTSATTTTTNPRPNDLPAATSTSAAQPFSAPLSPNPAEHEDDPESPANAAAEVRKRQRTPSSVPAGTVLRGLNFLKNKQDPLALEDAEYPDWLWETLRGKQEGAGAGGEGEGDLFSKSKKQRRKAAKALRRQQLLGMEEETQIPLYEQSTDLAGTSAKDGAGEVDVTKAQEAREELTGAMRKERRRKIKEDNFLRAMG